MLWQLEHLRANANPQFGQKRALAGFSVWQRGHCMVQILLKTRKRQDPDYSIIVLNGYEAY
jgi:hypothetical protein